MEGDITNNCTDPALNKKRWQNRRRMAWVSLSSMIIMAYCITFTSIVSESRLKVLSDGGVLTWFFLGCVSVIGAYMGVTTYASIKGK